MRMRLQSAGLMLFFLILSSVPAVIFLGCSGDDDTSVTPVTISGFSPVAGLSGDVVTITGTGFVKADSEVKFNGIAAAVSSATTTQLNVVVPVGAATGKITVTAHGQTATSTADFTISDLPLSVDEPTITGFSPTSGIIGDEVVITGTNLSTTPSDISVTINGVEAEIKAASTTQVSVIVPAEANTGLIAMSVKNQTVTSASPFTILAPTITSFTPTIGAENVSVVITGTNFCENIGQNLVKFNDVTATVTAATKTALTVKIAAGTTTGKVSVKVGPNTAVSTDALTICHSPELMIASVAFTEINPNNKVCKYSVTLFNPGGQRLDLSKWLVQTFAAKNADGSGTEATGGTALDVAGMIESGASVQFNGSAAITVTDASVTFVTNPYLVLKFSQKVKGSVKECNPEDNLVVARVVL